LNERDLALSLGSADRSHCEHAQSCLDSDWSAESYCYWHYEAQDTSHICRGLRCAECYRTPNNNPRGVSGTNSHSTRLSISGTQLYAFVYTSLLIFWKMFMEIQVGILMKLMSRYGVSNYGTVPELL